ncbi:TorF family putative porin [Ferrimonas marina]|uniref:Histidine kinase n=1 Tax=Ferrimonas marina TaxID=299255 RepID=A0A1M5XGM0_9GAMM|nr:TorF family putative porin [Ferrimonas marina]SHH98889.1 conserved hypothetical protein [Ferrimonas marina]
MKNAVSVAVGTILSASALLSAPAMADVSGNIGVTSDYLWRGVTQTDGAPAVSGGIDWGHDSGFYLGTWVSNIEFGDAATYEWDLYGGFGGEIGDFGYDVGYIYYAYPNGDDLDFGEVYGSIGWNWLGLNVSYGTNESADEKFYENALYVEGTLGFDLTDSVSLGFAIGHYSFDIDEDEDYLNYNLSLTKSTEAMGDFTFMVSDTDLDDDDPIFLVSWAYEFDI